MTAFSGHTILSQHGDSTEQIKELQHAIQENTLQLVRVRQKRQRAEKEIIQCTRETERRVDLIMENSGVVDALQQLGHLLQEERHLSDQLNDQASADRNDLLERNERITTKSRSLAAEILEVEERLAEAKARNDAAQTLIRAPTGKANKNKPK